MRHVSHRQTDIDITKRGNGAVGEDITCIGKKRRSAEGKPAERLTGRAVWDWQCCNRSGIFTPQCVHMCAPCFEPFGNYVQCWHIKKNVLAVDEWTHWWLLHDYYAMTVIYNVGGIWLMSRIFSSGVVAALNLRINKKKKSLCRWLQGFSGWNRPRTELLSCQEGWCKLCNISLAVNIFVAAVIRNICNCATVIVFKKIKCKSDYYSGRSHCYSLEAVDSLSWIDILTFIIFKNFKLGCYASMFG